MALALREPERAARLLGEDLELPRGELVAGAERFPAFRAGDVGLALVPAGHAFLSGGIAAGLDHLGMTGALPSRVSEAPERTAGVSLRAATGLELPKGASPWVERIDHIGITSADNTAAEAIFVGQLGLPFESRQTDIEVHTAIESFTSDKYGVIYHQRRPEPAGGLRVSFVTLGDCELEFLQEFDPSLGAHVEHGAAGTTKQDQGAIGRFAARHGPGLHHLALKTRDIDATLAHLSGRGHRMIDETGRPGSRGAKIGFLHPATTGGVLIHFVERIDPDRR
jgi:methylmalonyl-CoA epimerase